MRHDDTRLRLAIVGVVALALFASLFARLWYLQVLEAPEYQLAARANSVRVIREPALRGRILDRDGRVLVDNRASSAVLIDRTALPPAQRQSILSRLADVLALDASVIERRLDDRRASPYAPVIIAEGIPEDTLIMLRERANEFPGVIADRVPLRSYPNGPLAAHLLGYVGEINGEELAARSDVYAAGDDVGKAGVERVYDEALRGVAGTTRVEVDSRGRPVAVVGREEPVMGSDVTLSLDLDVQRVAEQALAQGLEAARGRSFGDTDQPLVADAGAAVVLDLEEGSVVAMASYPTFDPSALADGVGESEARALFDESSGAPFTNRAVQGQYAPGSTWKLVTAVAGIDRGVVTPETTIDDDGFYVIPECVGRCRFQNAGANRYGTVDLARAIAVSSDVYFYRLGAELWVRRDQLGESALQDTALQLGFGAQTGVALPSESDGRVPTPASRRKLFEERPDVYVTGGWFTGDNVNLAIGQGELTVTPLQLASVYGSFATGMPYSWNVALRIAPPGGQPVETIAPRRRDPLAVSEATRQAIMAGLRRALTDERGTATAAFSGFPLDRFPVAGKTGTAQATPKQDTALFVAVAPADAPRYAVAVVMEQAGYGASSAAPVARRILGALSGLEAPAPVEVVPGGQG